MIIDEKCAFKDIELMKFFFSFDNRREYFWIVVPQKDTEQSAKKQLISIVLFCSVAWL